MKNTFNQFCLLLGVWALIAVSILPAVTSINNEFQNYYNEFREVKNEKAKD